MTDCLPTTAVTERELIDAFRKAGPPDWLVEMQDHYARTGTFRPEDLRRLLGDPTRRVEIGPRPSFAALFGQR